MQQIQQQPNKIVEAREAYRKVLFEERNSTSQRLKSAETALKAAQAEMDAAKGAAERAEAEFTSFNTSNPQPTSQKGKGGKTAPAATNGTAIKAKANGGPAPKPKAAKTKVGRVVINPLIRQASGTTVPDRIAAQMGDRIWTAGELIDALSQAGESFKSTNLRSYISTTLNSADMSVPGPDGSLKYPDGRLLKVKRFTATDRGHYRVSTAEDIAAQIKKLLGASEVVISGTPADKVFSDQGLDVSRAVVNTQH